MMQYAKAREEGHYFTVDSLAAALPSVVRHLGRTPTDDDDFQRFAAAIIQAAKEAERE